MIIKFNDIDFTETEMILFLEKNGYRVEPHKSSIGISTIDTLVDKKFAIPNGEHFDINKHKGLNYIFNSLIKDKFKSLLLR